MIYEGTSQLVLLAISNKGIIYGIVFFLLRTPNPVHHALLDKRLIDQHIAIPVRSLSNNIVRGETASCPGNDSEEDI